MTDEIAKFSFSASDDILQLQENNLQFRNILFCKRGIRPRFLKVKQGYQEKWDLIQGTWSLGAAPQLLKVL